MSDIVKARLQKKKEKAPDIVLMKMNGDQFTIEDAVEEVEKDTHLGKVIREAEEKMVERLKEKEEKTLG